MTGKIIEKEFIKKNGQPSGIFELYFQNNEGTWWIKFCEGKVKSDELKKYLNKEISIDGNIVEFGMLDICPGDPREMQSRVGTYIVIDGIK